MDGEIQNDRGMCCTSVAPLTVRMLVQILKKAAATVHDRAPWQHDTTIGQALLTPTIIYVNDLLTLKAKVLPCSRLVSGISWKTLTSFVKTAECAEIAALVLGCCCHLVIAGHTLDAELCKREKLTLFLKAPVNAAFKAIQTPVDNPNFDIPRVFVTLSLFRLRVLCISLHIKLANPTFQ